jgi:hypothetical protein
MPEESVHYAHQDCWDWVNVRAAALGIPFKTLYIFDFAVLFIIIRWEL